MRVLVDQSNAKPEVLVLLSGGIDSSALLGFYRAQKIPSGCLHVDYGQLAGRNELVAARASADHFKVPLMQVTLQSISRKGVGEVSSRNAMLLCIAAMEAPPSVWGISIGIHAGSTYGDCSPHFVDAMNVVLSLQTRPVKALAPFLTWTRPDILEYCRQNDIPLEATYSCEAGTSPPCGTCLSCNDREGMNARA